jgi:hypothetical protein
VAKHFNTMSGINEPLKTASEGDHELVLEAIESLKRWIYREHYKGPDKEPVPTTADEFSMLMDGLRRWATLHAPHIDTGRIQDYRRAEFSLPDACGPVRVFPDRAGEQMWWQTAFKADDALNELKIVLRAAIEKTPKKRTPQTQGDEMEALGESIAPLEDRLPGLADDLRSAVAYLISDPQSSLTKARISLEKALLARYRKVMKKEPKQVAVGQMLHDQAFTASIPRRVLAWMNAVREMSNLGAHGDEVDPTDAARAMQDLIKVLEWLVQNE